jgi:hypothetical protein
MGDGVWIIVLPALRLSHILDKRKSTWDRAGKIDAPDDEHILITMRFALECQIPIRGDASHGE